jgi:hypothetical protein
MSREMYLTMNESDVTAACAKEQVGISAIESLPDGGGVRLVCMSSTGAEAIRTKLKRHLIAGDVTRERYRPSRPLW